MRSCIFFSLTPTKYKQYAEIYFLYKIEEKSKDIFFEKRLLTFYLPHNRFSLNFFQKHRIALRSSTMLLFVKIPIEL